MAAGDKTDRAHVAFDRLRLAAEAAGFTLLSASWQTWKSSYSFRCREGHQFDRSATSIIYHDNACPHCRLGYRLAQLKHAAEEKGGRCLELIWLGSEVAHRFQCTCGHVWKARPSKIISEGSWCRRCAQQEHSKRMQRADGLAALQGMAAAKGGSMLDAEYAGMHARYRFACANGHHWQAQGSEIVRGSWCRACADADKRIRYRLSNGLERLQAAAQARQGLCLSTEYITGHASYRFRCQRGHEWQAPGHRIFRGAWCPACANENKRLTIEQMRQMAQTRGGRCLSELYQNNATKLHWECHRGHQWQAVAGSIVQGHWCPMCAHFSRISTRHSKARSKYLPAA